ncbi:MAG: HEPN domain-containing protein [Zetaproteobacteria bacterium]|nr:HEPN domain-containing protein [Zetaproteobacteria bacterium]
MIEFVSFSKCTDEINTLHETTKYIIQSNSSPKKVINRVLLSHLILLGTLLESFTENIIREYMDKIILLFNSGKISFIQLPESIQHFIAKSAVEQHSGKKGFSELKTKQILKMMSQFINRIGSKGFFIDRELEGIEKFSFGKHGEGEIKKTLQRIGIEVKHNNMSFETLNAFFALRNQLIHPENITAEVPADVGLDQVEYFTGEILIYATALHKILQTELANFCK